MIDTSFDFRTDAKGRDPDSYSPTLRRYHRLLWSKPLPNGDPFELVETSPRIYLHHRSHLGEYFLASDSIIPSFKSWLAFRPVLEQLSEQEVESFRTVGYTIGGMMVFPGNQIDGKWTINMARGMTRKIADRMDLTLECIRRHYERDVNTPLGPALARYPKFFGLFGDFQGYVRFFLLQDLVDESNGSVRFFMPFADFSRPALPQDVDSYRAYRQSSIDFIEARNCRLEQWDGDHLSA